MSIDHSAFMESVESLWALINSGGIAAGALTLMCGFGIFMLIKGMTSGGMGDGNTSDSSSTALED